MALETRTIAVYNSAACLPAVYGCTATDAINYNPLATEDNGTCEWGSDPRGPENFVKNNCSGGTPSTVAFSVPPNWRKSGPGVGANKAAANTLRDTDFPAAGQLNANTLGNCGGSTPDLQFEGPIYCKFQHPRTDASTVQRKRDRSPVSATYLKWGKLNGTFVDLEADGDYYDRGIADTTICPNSTEVNVQFILVDTFTSQQVPFTSNRGIGKIVVNYKTNGVNQIATKNSNTDVNFSIFADIGSQMTLSASTQQGQVGFVEYTGTGQSGSSITIDIGFQPIEIEALYRTT